MNPIARAEADAEPEPETDLDPASIDAHLSSFLQHLVQPPRAEPKADPDSDAEPEPEPDLDPASIDELLNSSLKRFVQQARSLPLPSLPYKVSPVDIYELSLRAERFMGQDDLFGLFSSSRRDPEAPKAEVIDSVDAHERSAGVGRTDDECSICLTYVTAGPLSSAPPCGHLFHDECLQKAMLVDPNDAKKHVLKNCALCRGEFPDG